jgi:hypothetical protein
MALAAEEFDLGAELESLVDLFAVQCSGKGIEIGLDLPGGVLCLFFVPTNPLGADRYWGRPDIEKSPFETYFNRVQQNPGSRSYCHQWQNVQSF